MTEAADSTFDRALDGTAYWTLSLYIAAESLRPYYSPALIDDPGAALRAAQLRHKPSFALRNAIDPLFNDIADRDFFGRPRDFLFAAGQGATKAGADWTLASAGDAIRTETELVFTVPPRFSWVTEGVRFHCDLKQQLERKVRLRRCWFAHSDGALSYHLSFEHHYRTGPGASPRDILHDPYGMQTFYFLSLLQKLAAPKEFMLGEEQLEKLTKAQGDEVFLNPFLSDAPTGIDPLDGMKVREGDGTPGSFWRFVRDKFVGDARILLGEVLKVPEQINDAQLEALPAMTEVIEVPGLKLPRCRYLFHIDDKRFFDRLLPVDPGSTEGLPRKRMVREQCFVPFRAMIDGLTRPKDGPPAQEAWLGAEAGQEHGLKWSEFDLTETYEEWIKEGIFLDPDGALFPDEPALKQALRSGTSLITYDAADQPIDPPIKVHIPAYETGRADCLDYLFLSGFNQNIIDWLNQDTSEILDSIDPIYPTEDVQADERFFVRYANHRGMITYVAGSRSLEIGNDYLGTCPYAFLIHVLAMHNEFLARDHEKRSADKIEMIDREVQALRHAAINEELRDRSQKLETEINDLKLASYRQYERHRYLNIFRYDTEAAVFARLAELRGTDWRGAAMERALETLEEYANDLDRRQAKTLAAIEEQAKEQERLLAKALEVRHRERDRRLSALIGAVGLISGVGTLFSLVDYFENHPGWPWPFGPRSHEAWAPWLLGNFAWILAVGGLLALVWLAMLQRQEIWGTLRELLWPRKRKPERDPVSGEDA
jgi:hypothetical protein